METSYETSGEFLGKLGDVFGDPTRRGIYRHVRQTGEPLTATEVADVFGLHRTVARAHLERLYELGLVETATRKQAAGGRPAKTYAISAARLEVMLPPRRYERLSRLLLRLIDATLDEEAASAAASELGLASGREMAATLIGADADDDLAAPGLPPEAAVEWLDATGYGATLSRNGRVVIECHNCVYRELSVEYPHIVCAFDRGMICGLLGVTTAVHTQELSLSSGDAVCRHEFAL